MDETAAARATDSTDDIVVARLRRHVPEIAVRWVLDEPERTWRTVEGSLCFADISGFTALSERLEGRGRRGAEELVDTLNRVFGAMLDVAARRGGELLKFGGDALLFLFTGPGHATRAAATAAEMHRGLRRAADEPTAFGRLHLSMSVGVGSGEIHLFLVGDPHRELVLAGPVLDATIVAENRAVAGETLLAPATAAALPAPASTLHGDGHHGVLRWRKAPAAVPERPVAAPPAIAPGELSALLPATLADALGSAVEPGHRSATISFIRLSGTDALLEEEGPAHLAAALDTSVRAVQAALGAEGLTLLTVDVDSDGAKCFCAAGVPAGTEDDEGRMLRALRRVVTAELPLVVQAGVNRGHVFAAEIGGTHRAAYSAMGDATNTAARIAAKAPPGALYAHPAVLERARTRYDSEPAGPFVFKGKSEPLVVYAVGPALGLREDATDQHLPMIGRDAEVAVILAAIARVTTGAGSVLTIAGAAGLGKTRLAQETINTSGLPMLVARSEPYGAASPYHSFRDPLRRLLGIERDDAAAMATSLLAAIDRLAPELRPFAPLLGDVVHIEVPTTPEVEAIASRHRPDRTADIVIDVVRRAHPGPLIVGAEDAQWADEATAHLLTRIEAATVELPWLLVVVRRGGDGGFAPHGGERIVLEPLPDGSIRELT
ncbi:MAG: AAA family ATPase, partial [Actinomycetota bacterium]|nr:AAA family ATPase [Actinomycetota bacterium]